MSAHQIKTTPALQLVEILVSFIDIVCQTCYTPGKHGFPCTVGTGTGSIVLVSLPILCFLQHLWD